MKCNEFIERMSEYLDGTLAERGAFESHRQACPACAEELALFEKAMGALDAWPELEPSPTFVAKVWEKIRHEPVARPSLWELAVRWMAGHRAVLSLATVAVLLGGSLAVLTPSSQPDDEVVTVAVTEILPEATLGEDELLPEPPDPAVALVEWEKDDPLLKEAEYILETF